MAIFLLFHMVVVTGIHVTAGQLLHYIALRSIGHQIWVVYLCD